jgi:hypothetical protein
MLKFFSEKHAVSIFRAEVTSREVEGIYRIWGAKAEGREPVREKECAKGMRKMCMHACMCVCVCTRACVCNTVS